MMDGLEYGTKQCSPAVAIIGAFQDTRQVTDIDGTPICVHFLVHARGLLAAGAEQADEGERRAAPGGYEHLSEAVPEDGCRQLVSEVYDAGKGTWNVRQGERNEWLDCRIGARAAAYWAGVDMMSGDDWQALREEYAGPTPEQLRAEPERHRREPPPRKEPWIPRRSGRWL
jgi:hypothetical protein